MMRLAAAAIVGYLAMIALVIVTYIELEGTNFLFVNLLLAFPYGFGGGWVSAKIAKEREIAAGFLVGAVAIVMSLIAYARNPDALPGWYWTALTASLTAGAVYGAFRKFISV